ncbi:MAG TPA: hypothetical protein VN688_06190 [Gemmataceae bacterium]|nr:hypothetical protein [Gemmataceae bacterium]
MALASRYLTITQGNLDNSHIYLTEVMDLFPDDVFGGHDEAHAAPRRVQILWGDEAVDTDIVREKHIFRRRGWVSRFFEANRIGAGDQVMLEQLEPYVYRVKRVAE